jgi:hypothetical protein
VPDVLSQQDGPDAEPNKEYLESQFLYTLPLLHETDWPMFYHSDYGQVSRNLLMPHSLRELEKDKKQFTIKDVQVHRLVITGDGKTRTVPFLPFAQRADTIEELHEILRRLGTESLLPTIA